MPSGQDGSRRVKEMLAAINVDELAAELREDFRRPAVRKRSASSNVWKLSKPSRNPEIARMDDPRCPACPAAGASPDGSAGRRRFEPPILTTFPARVINRNNRLNKLLQLGAPKSCPQ